ncbi:MAG: hypothetical protein WAK17_28685 [Candidatus Nitrosopolaris sp.]|jgi:hypothetical protein
MNIQNLDIQYTDRTCLQSHPEWNTKGIIIAYDSNDSIGVALDLSISSSCTDSGNLATYNDHFDHRLTDQSSILCFIEANCSIGRMRNQSFDIKAGHSNGYRQSDKEKQEEEDEGDDDDDNDNEE